MFGDTDMEEESHRLLFGVVVQAGNKHEREHNVQRASNDVQTESAIIWDSVQ